MFQSYAVHPTHVKTSIDILAYFIVYIEDLYNKTSIYLVSYMKLRLVQVDSFSILCNVMSHIWIISESFYFTELLMHLDGFPFAYVLLSCWG